MKRYSKIARANQIAVEQARYQLERAIYHEEIYKSKVKSLKEQLLNEEKFIKSTSSTDDYVEQYLRWANILHNNLRIYKSKLNDAYNNTNLARAVLGTAVANQQLMRKRLFEEAVEMLVWFNRPDM